MYSRNEPAFAAVFASICQRATESSFLETFREQSITGNNCRIIEIVQGIPEFQKLTITESYLPKNNEQAKVFLQEADDAGKNEEINSFLTKAVFAAEIECDEQEVFFDALARRIRWSFASLNLIQCLTDCRYMVSRLNERAVHPSSELAYYQICRIECMSYETRCLKILGDLGRAQALARDGIREAKYYFQRSEQDGLTVSYEKKLDQLRPFLDVLKEKKTNLGICDREAGITRLTISLPELSGKRNNKLQKCSDVVALRYDKIRGRHLVATRNIKIGSVLIIDEPFAWSTDMDMLERNCLHCHQSLNSPNAVKIPCHKCQTVTFCSEDCRIESWRMYHRWECTIFDYLYRMQSTHSSRLLLAYRATVLLATQNINVESGKLSPDLTKYCFKNDSVAKELEMGLNDVYDPLNYRTVYSLETNKEGMSLKVNLMHVLHSVLLAKCFRFVASKIMPKVRIGEKEETALVGATLHHLRAINCNAYEIVENVLDPCTKVWEPKTVGGAIYTTVSLTNHSCFPNIVRHTYPKGKVVVRAIRFIEKGSEIFDCYGPHFLRDVKAKRLDYLLKKYNFKCTCEACTKNWGPSLSPDVYKCRNCFEIYEKLRNFCAKCGIKIDKVKINKAIEKSIQWKSTAIQKMLDGDHAAALPLLLNHSELVDKVFADCSLEAIKTQQALIQCFNSMGCISQ